MSEEVDQEKLKKEIKDILPEDFSDDIKQLKEIQKKQTQTIAQISSNHDHVHVDGDKGSPHSHEKKHEHRTHSYDKVCPDCGENNPDYDKNQYTCESCGEDVGTRTEALKSVACPHCGSDEGAQGKEEGITL